MQNTLFKIHQHFLTRHSPVFKDLFTLNNPSPNEEMDDGHPIFLPGDDPVGFCRLLQVFYHEYVSSHTLIPSTDRIWTQ
jgi:hypothetical protein